MSKMNMFNKVDALDFTSILAENESLDKLKEDNSKYCKNCFNAFEGEGDLCDNCKRILNEITDEEKDAVLAAQEVESYFAIMGVTDITELDLDGQRELITDCLDNYFGEGRWSPEMFKAVAREVGAFGLLNESEDEIADVQSEISDLQSGVNDLEKIKDVSKNKRIEIGGKEYTDSSAKKEIKKLDKKLNKLAKDKNTNLRNAFGDNELREDENLDRAKFDLDNYVEEFEYAPDIELEDQFLSSMDSTYFTVVKTVREAEKFNYHSDYWGSADGYQEEAVDVLETLEPYMGKIVRTDNLIEGKSLFILKGVAIDKQYNSVSHMKILVAEETPTTENINESANGKNNLNEMGNFAGRMDALRAAGDRETKYRNDVANQKNKKIKELFKRLKEIQDDVAELKEIGKHVKLYDLKGRFNIWLDASDRGLDYANPQESREVLLVDTDKILMDEPSLATSEVTVEELTKPNPWNHKDVFIRLATGMLDIYPNYIKAVNQMIDEYDLKYPVESDVQKIDEAIATVTTVDNIDQESKDKATIAKAVEIAGNKTSIDNDTFRDLRYKLANKDYDVVDRLKDYALVRGEDVIYTWLRDEDKNLKESAEPSFLVTSISWETDGEDAKTLPKSTNIPVAKLDIEDLANDEEVEEKLNNYLSDNYGYLVKDYTYELNEGVNINIADGNVNVSTDDKNVNVNSNNDVSVSTDNVIADITADNVNISVQDTEPAIDLPTDGNVPGVEETPVDPIEEVPAEEPVLDQPVEEPIENPTEGPVEGVGEEGDLEESVEFSQIMDEMDKAESYEALEATIDKIWSSVTKNFLKTKLNEYKGNNEDIKSARESIKNYFYDSIVTEGALQVNDIPGKVDQDTKHKRIELAKMESEDKVTYRVSYLNEDDEELAGWDIDADSDEDALAKLDKFADANEVADDLLKAEFVSTGIDGISSLNYKNTNIMLSSDDDENIITINQDGMDPVVLKDESFDKVLNDLMYWVIMNLDDEDQDSEPESGSEEKSEPETPDTDEETEEGE